MFSWFSKLWDDTINHDSHILYLFDFQEAKRAFESVMMIRPRRPVTDEFLDFEKEAMKRATDHYGYVWPEGAEVFEPGISNIDFRTCTATL